MAWGTRLRALVRLCSPLYALAPDQASRKELRCSTWTSEHNRLMYSYKFYDNKKE
jgi:hypothetical protein